MKSKVRKKRLERKNVSGCLSNVLFPIAIRAHLALHPVVHPTSVTDPPLPPPSTTGEAVKTVTTRSLDIISLKGYCRFYDEL